MIERKAHTRNKITMLSNKIVCHKTFYHIFVNLKESSRLRFFVLFLVSLCIFSLLITLKIKFGLLLCTCGDQRTAVGVSSLLPPLGSQGDDVRLSCSVARAFPTDSPHQPCSLSLSYSDKTMCSSTLIPHPS